MAYATRAVSEKPLSRAGRQLEEPDQGLGSAGLNEDQLGAAGAKEFADVFRGDRRGKRDWELTVITRDRPFLFTSLTGSLAAWGMNILKADAFGNKAGVVTDTFRFADLHGTLELNPSEVERFQKFTVDVLNGSASFDSLLAGRMDHHVGTRAKVKVPTYIGFDDQSSSHSTLLELVTQDRPGLLYRVSTDS